MKEEEVTPAIAPTAAVAEPAEQRSLVAQIKLVSKLLRKRFDERARAVALSEGADRGEALTQAQWRALATIYLNAGCTQKELAEKLEIGPVATGQTVDRLERLSWITRRSDPGDRRVNRLHVTDAALPILERLGVFADREDYFAAVGLSPEKMATLTALLDEVIGNLSSAKEPGGVNSSAATRS
ncbi:DNA-binding transcriptional regulator, MarR family [Sphingomonas palmae]|uniref:DNA-binding transcriptional regulator, MarR family n=1 Tax=Sphingomonas palmae TaxID=1855283 RepID=A0A1H7KV01_9SPHN|nr:MarR family transcriptional regulator [Sphingomonas palmae]SEK90639.1 DNA-binding transcriptional regulator, MarR family [Sphingomonas palmae]